MNPAPAPHQPEEGPIVPVPGATDPPLPPAPAPAPLPSEAPEGVIDTIIAAAAEHVSQIVKPDAAVAVTVTFGFPLVLTVAVTTFLAVQHRLDSRDPKLRLAPQHHVETVLQFREEAEL
jgi:hypothetical protein